MLSVAELSRVQTFPEDFQILGSRRAAQRQIGNAVPAALAEMLGLEIRRQLLEDRVDRRKPSLLPKRRDDCPPPETVKQVPDAFVHLIGDPKPHPGPGKGPAHAKTAGQK